MKLNALKPATGSVKTSKRIGRGTGSGKGGTSTRGHKGAKSRSGYSSKAGHEGGQMPLYRRVPKFGFNNPFKVSYKALNLDVLQSLASKTNASVIDLELLYSNGLVGKGDLVKVLSRGELTSKIEIKAHSFSKSAVAAIEKVGAKATVLE
ncbi:MAG: 50S ribosomal protein L15 [Cytophagaceae bacterium]|jgi:large subunit ribosomal protein L15|nr:50S ribosomal protein L15 [Cytophagaceae bacterium]